MNPIEIQIVADASSIQAVLKKTESLVTQFVGGINEQGIDWTSILSKTAGPAVLGSIATMFSLALAQALNFQTTMAQTSATSSDAFAGMGNVVKNNAVAIGDSTLQSAGEVAISQGMIVSAFGKSTPMLNTMVTAAGELATMYSMPLSTATQDLITLFKDWGITTLPAATEAIDALYVGAKNSGMGFGEFIKTLSDSGPAMSAIMTLKQASYGLSTLGSTSGMTVAQVEEMWGSIAKAIQNPYDKLNLFMQLQNGMTVSADAQKNGVIKAYEDIVTGVQKSGATAQILYSQFGIPPDVISQMQNTTKQTFGAMDLQILNLNKDVLTLAQGFNTMVASSATLQVTAGMNAVKNYFTVTLPDAIEAAAKSLAHPMATEQINQGQKGTTPAIDTSAGGNWLSAIVGQIIEMAMGANLSGGNYPKYTPKTQGVDATFNFSGLSSTSLPAFTPDMSPLKSSAGNNSSVSSDAASALLIVSLNNLTNAIKTATPTPTIGGVNPAKNKSGVATSSSFMEQLYTKFSTGQ